jgi:hypothetical protein
MSKENITYKVTLKQVMYKELKNGAVIVYKLVVNDDYNLPLDDFYFATFDDTSSEVVWGVGSNIEDALESAAQMWDSPDNPFREALAQFE